MRREAKVGVQRLAPLGPKALLYPSPDDALPPPCRSLSSRSCTPGPMQDREELLGEASSLSRDDMDEASCRLELHHLSAGPRTTPGFDCTATAYSNWAAHSDWAAYFG